MKVGIIGYGVMGKIIAGILTEKGITISSIIDPVDPAATHKEISATSLQHADVCIDFTIPKIAVANIEKMAALKKNIVMGTTGWYGEMDNVKGIIKKHKVGFIWSGNFSIGVNMFFRMIREAAMIADHVPEYDVLMYEQHHRRKQDSPSGTADMIGTILLEEIDRKKKIVTESLHRQIAADELHMASVRGGSIPGTHSVLFDSAFDTIELKHTARNREGFARGAVMAAQYIHGKVGFYHIDDMMNALLGAKHA